MKFNKKQIQESLDKLRALAIGMGWGKSENYEKY